MAAERDAKSRALVRAEGLRLAAESAAVRGSDPGLALLLAIEAAIRHPSGLANESLLSALDECRECRTLRGDFSGACFGPQGSTVLTYGGSDGSPPTLWDAQSGRELAHFECSGPVRAVAFSPDGNKVLALESSSNSEAACVARVFDVASANELAGISGIVVSDDYPAAGAFSLGGDTVILPCGDQTAKVFRCGNR